LFTKLLLLYGKQSSITSGEMADCDWLRSTFSGPLISPLRRENNGPLKVLLSQSREIIIKRMQFKTKQQN
jgi:hypothetical protein